MTMKRILIFLLVLPLLLNWSPLTCAEENSERVMVYYFHGTARCPSCYRIERYTKEAVEQHFKAELDSGKVVYKAVNVEEKEHRHFIERYQLYTKSVIVSLSDNGEEVKFKNLEKVWQYLWARDKFVSYIKSEVEEYLREIK